MTKEKPTVRKIYSETGFEFILLYINQPDKLKWYHQQEHCSPSCILCSNAHNSSHNIELGNYVINSELSLFEGHKLLISKSHDGEYIVGHLRYILDFIKKNDNKIIAYDGNKNTKIKNYHFYCHVIDNQVDIPIIKEYPKASLLITKEDLSISVMENYGRGPIFLESTSAETIANAFYELEKHIGVNFSNNQHPYINLYIWLRDNKYVTAIIPRAVFKPTEYYDANNDWNTAISALEVGGLFLLKKHEVFLHTDADFLIKLCNEVSFNSEHAKEIVKSLDI